MLSKDKFISMLDLLYQSLELPLFLLDQDYQILQQCSSFFPLPTSFLKELFADMKAYHGKLLTMFKDQEVYFLIPYEDETLCYVCIGPILLRIVPRHINLDQIAFYRHLSTYIDPTIFLDKVGFLGDNTIFKIKLLYQLVKDQGIEVDEVRQSLHASQSSWSKNPISNRLFQKREEAQEASYRTQIKCLHAITLGDSMTARMYASKVMSGSIGAMSNDEVRKSKYAFVAGVTLITRAMIQAGVPISSAYSLSDVFIQKMDEAYSPEQIINLYHDCIVQACTYVKKFKYGKQYPVWVRSCMEYIEKNLHSTITLDDIAKVVHMAPAYISIQFKAICKQSITEYINIQKVKEAEYLLQSSDMSIQEIALTLGFSTQSYFAKIFKRYHGEQPNVYRSQQK